MIESPSPLCGLDISCDRRGGPTGLTIMMKYCTNIDDQPLPVNQLDYRGLTRCLHIPIPSNISRLDGRSGKDRKVAAEENGRPVRRESAAPYRTRLTGWLIRRPVGPPAGPPPFLAAQFSIFAPESLTSSAQTGPCSAMKAAKSCGDPG